VRRHVIMVLWCTAVLWWGSAQPAHAYIDPATTSYLIQIASAIIISASVAIGVFFTRIQTFLITARPRIGVWFRRTVAWFAHAQPPGLVPPGSTRGVSTGSVSTGSTTPILDPKLRAAVDAALAAGATGGGTTTTSTTAGATSAPATSWRRKLFADDRPWIHRLAVAVLAALGITVPLLAAGPVELFAANITDLPISLGTVIGAGIVTALSVGAVAGLLVSLLRGRAFDVAVSLLVGVGLASWVQLFMNIDTGSFTGEQFPWNQHLGQTLLNSLVWGVLMGLPVLVRYLSRQVWRMVVAIVPAILMTIGVVSATAAAVPLPMGGTTGRYLSMAGLDEVSSTNNIIVFLVDATDESVIRDLGQASDFSFGPLEGFTSFDQNAARYQETFPALPFMLTGADYLWNQLRSAYFRNAYDTSSFLPELKRLGFRINMYTAAEDLYWLPDDVTRLIDNLSPAKPKVNYPAMMGAMVRLSAFSRSPLSLQPSLWLDPDAFSGTLQGSAGQAAPYVIDDVALYKQILDHPLRIAGPQPQFSLIHMFAAHQPFTMDDQGQRVPSTSRLKQAEGTFKIIYTYLDQLRALGLYDSSTILIMADHGTHLPWQQRVLTAPLLPSLLVKPANAPHTPLQHSSAPTYMTNFQATIMQAAGGDPAPFGQTYFQVPEDAVITRRFYWIRPAIGSYTGELQVFDITGDALDFRNWRLVGTLPMTEGFYR